MSIDLQALIEQAQKSMAPKSREEAEQAKAAALHDAMIVWRALDNPHGQALLDLLYRKFGEPVIFDARSVSRTARRSASSARARPRS
ncbi:MAG: hypothetical protein WDM81_13890 [Rhizomicrobium sp.]